ncbi:hypothetical protein EDC26_104204 [Paralcaligenes ureilyticus]|uniref:Polyvalent protein metallopeptidase domain-containing protein n=1 Tax=Paralcaligenes ureilyticus TaxID=627131 RepID=A0A4R3M6K6_9BURK|nr:zincin-like metallopeptidase domain-containing protein [Paralcaligenes ureilyticus]TCT09044.1 hypothetical protein EDC26_104204 [Paralcaligenes ureilyticus]
MDCHESHKNRTFGRKFGDDAYAIEELVAELGSVFLCASLGFVDSTIEWHASYLDSWIKVLKANGSTVFCAVSAAQKAFDLIQASSELVALAE